LQFETLAEYISAYRADPSIVGLPVPVVAEPLGLSPAAVTARVRSGSLEGLRIGRHSFVALQSLLNDEDKMAADVLAVERYLWKQAKAGVTAIFYEPVMATVGLTPRVPAERNRIGAILGKVSENSMEEGKVMLSVLVHRKTAGVTRPGPGFFDLARHFGFEFEDEDDFVKKQTAKVLKLAAKQG